MTDKIDVASRHITRGTDNIFADLGFDETEAALLLKESDEEIRQLTAMKRAVMVEISTWMTENNMKQVQAAKALHVTRPRVSDVVNFKTEKFTLDALLGMAGNIGKKFHLVLE
ncbi:helix-turn-helix domain-containing protein [Candidatus Pantoea formicae]|uniref:helix-turn-helix domain-containing protein n=1 Tax=Candidatus Pantoea formicae TaxID=2608355 RepID=UPI003ED88FE5